MWVLNMSYKKAGIIVGAFIIVIVIITVIVINSTSNDNKPNKQPTETTAVTTTAQVAWENPVEVDTSSKSTLIEIDSETLPTAVTSSKIGIVQDKTMVLLDGSLYYVLYLLVGTDNVQMTYFVSKTGYDAVNLGDKCNVMLETYTTTNGSVYNLISGLSLVE